jgi:PilZ domain
MLRDSIERVLKEYKTAKTASLSGHPLAQVITKSLPDYITGLIRAPTRFKVEGSSGKGSLGGAAILSDLTIARGEYLALKITFPTQAAAIEVELAPVRWVKPGSFGVEFIRIAPGSQQRIHDYLTTLEDAASHAP